MHAQCLVHHLTFIFFVVHFMTNKTELWLIRHGETAWNAKQRLQGWADIPLNEVGREQAKNLQRYFQEKEICRLFDSVVSSDLLRAAETAQIALGHRALELRTEASLRERSYGIYEGKYWRNLMRPVEDDVTSDESTQLPNLRQPDQEIPEGESLSQFHERIKTAFETLAEQYAGQRIAVFAHGGVIDIAWRLTHGLDLYAQRPRPIANTSINHFAIFTQTRQWQPIQWEITEHLQRSAP